MIRYGFFNSVSGDRTYNADDFSNFFEGVIGDGIFKKVGLEFETSISSAGKIVVGSGRAMVKNKWIESTANETLTPLTPEENTVRIDSVVLRCDMTSRSIGMEVKKGSAASAPDLEDSAQIKEIRIANVTMAAGSAKPSSIEDAREESWIHPLVGVRVTQIKKEIVTSFAITSLTFGNGIANFDLEKDALNIYINGILLKESEYTVSGNGISAKADFKFTIQPDNRVTFVILKSVAE